MWSVRPTKSLWSATSRPLRWSPASLTAPARKQSSGPTSPTTSLLTPTHPESTTRKPPPVMSATPMILTIPISHVPAPLRSATPLLSATKTPPPVSLCETILFICYLRFHSILFFRSCCIFSLLNDTPSPLPTSFFLPS